MVSEERKMKEGAALDSLRAIEIKIARTLAANEKKIRDRGFKKLRMWLMARLSGTTEFTEEDFKRIWTGLFYNHWMSDKPETQQENALNISSLVTSFTAKPDIGLLFCKVFFDKMAQEWRLIDRHRVDKYMQLVRFVLRESMGLVNRHQWETQLTENFADMIGKCVLNTTIGAVPDGLQMHFLDIFLEEFVEVAKEINNSIFKALLPPFVAVIAKSSSVHIRKYVAEKIFFNVLKIKHEKTVKTNIDFSEMADILLEAAIKCSSTKNAKLLHNIVRKYRDMAGGLYPLQQKIKKPGTSQLHPEFLRSFYENNLRECIASKIATKRKAEEVSPNNNKKFKATSKDTVKSPPAVRRIKPIKMPSPFIVSTVNDTDETTGNITHKHLINAFSVSDMEEPCLNGHQLVPSNVPCLGTPKTMRVPSPIKSSSKRVTFALFRNSSHEHKDYRKSIERSPAVPFDAIKKPAHGLLKTRRRAADFF